MGETFHSKGFYRGKKLLKGIAFSLAEHHKKILIIFEILARLQEMQVHFQHDKFILEREFVTESNMYTEHFNEGKVPPLYHIGGVSPSVGT